MRGNNYLIIFILFLFQSGFSQSILKGKVISEVNPDGIEVVNFTSKTSAVTSDGGFFSIEAVPGDILIFAAKHIEGVQIRLDSFSFKKDILNIVVKAKVNELEEIKVKSITAKSMGIVSQSVKEYTPAERRLKTAGKLKWYSPLLIPVGGMSVDALINQVSGRTSLLKKELAVEQKEKLLSDLNEMYKESFYTETLEIPQNYIKGFQIYTLDNAKFVEALKSKNRTLVTFLIGDVATEFKTLVMNENK